MKAKEYYAKYKDRIASVDDKESLQGVCDMLHEFCMVRSGSCCMEGG